MTATAGTSSTPLRSLGHDRHFDRGARPATASGSLNAEPDRRRGAAGSTCAGRAIDDASCLLSRPPGPAMCAVAAVLDAREVRDGHGGHDLQVLRDRSRAARGRLPRLPPGRRRCASAWRRRRRSARARSRGRPGIAAACQRRFAPARDRASASSLFAPRFLDFAPRGDALRDQARQPRTAALASLQPRVAWLTAGFVRRPTSEASVGMSKRTSRSPSATASPSAFGNSAMRAASGAVMIQSAPGAGRDRAGHGDEAVESCRAARLPP